MFARREFIITKFTHVAQLARERHFTNRFFLFPLRFIFGFVPFRRSGRISLSVYGRTWNEPKNQSPQTPQTPQTPRILPECKVTAGWGEDTIGSLIFPLSILLFSYHFERIWKGKEKVKTLFPRSLFLKLFAKNVYVYTGCLGDGSVSIIPVARGTGARYWWFRQQYLLKSSITRAPPLLNNNFYFSREKKKDSPREMGLLWHRVLSVVKGYSRDTHLCCGDTECLFTGSPGNPISNSI